MSYYHIVCIAHITVQNLVNSCCVSEGGKNYNVHAQLFQYSLNSLFNDVAIAIMVSMQLLISFPGRLLV